jgi:ectoine hydroxylase
MNLTPNQHNEFKINGYLQLDEIFNKNEIESLTNCVEEIERKPFPGHIYEKNNKEFRALHGCHLYSEIFNELIRSPKLLNSAKEILNEDVYVHQLKVNLKKPFNGEQWPWHQDYVYWQKKDGILKDSIISVMIYLDDITEFNGPLFLIPKSHAIGCVEPIMTSEHKQEWNQDVSSELSYQIDQSLVKNLIKENGIVSSKGKKGTIVWFNGNIVHASPANISPFQRRIIIITYNGISNKPKINVDEMRPEFLCARDTSPLFLTNAEIA